MSRDAFMDKFIDFRKEHNLSIEEAAAITGVSTTSLSMYESGMMAPSIGFIEKAEKIIGFSTGDTNFQNIFTQGYFGSKIPLLTEYDLVNDCDYHVIYYYELPQLEKYGENNLFALMYVGDDIPEKGILNGAVLVFVKCSKITSDGVYAVVSRGALKFKNAEIVDSNVIKLTPLDGKRRIPTRVKSSSANGRLVCCINTYD